MNKIYLIFILTAVSVTAVWFAMGNKDAGEQIKEEPPVAEELITARGESDLIKIFTPKPGDVIASPLIVEGEARGVWFFEASFPIILTDWDGRIIAEHFAQARGEWMSEDYVPFKGVIEFENPSREEDFSKRGSLILKKDNPSGLPQHDDALEIPVLFE